MAEAFDPYHKWLGIPPEDQPADHYRLLAIKLFETDPDVIAAAADRQMSHLRTYQTGPHGPLSQRLLNELAAARICLLNAEKKAAYDRQLRASMAKGVGSLLPPRGLGAGEAASRQKTPDPVPLPPVVARVASPEGGGPSDQETGDWSGLRELGEYRLLEKVGAGGMGEVYKAVHTEMDRVVAVKVLPPGHLQDDHAVARFKREIKAVASLSHPNIVQAYDAREIEGTRFLVMEYVEGMDLRDVARRLGPFPIPDACELIRQAALGLQSAHEHGLVHRDIKPGNLMLTAEGQVKLLDLGLARPQAEQGDAEVTGTGEAMGTADYMAPEQARDSRSVDIRADLYSVGCTLYRLITGRAPFSGPKYNTPVKKLMGHIQDPVPPITRIRPDVPKRLEIVLGRLLAKDPAKRLATPADLAHAMVPLSVGHDLAGLYARALGRIPAPPAPAQAEVATHSSQSSGLTRFFEKFKRPAPEPAGGPTAATSKPIPAWAGYAAIGAVALLVILAWGVWSASRQGDRPSAEGENGTVASQEEDSRPEPPRPGPGPLKPSQSAGLLVLQWPADERGDAMLQIDDQRREVAELVSRTDPETLNVDLEPGPHKVWIVRRGYEPFEQIVTVEARKIATLRPQWKRVELTVVEPVEPEPVEPKPPDVAVEKPKPPELDPAEKARLAAEARYAEALAPVEALVARWDFSRAVEALAKIEFDEPELMARRNARGREVQRLVALKARIIARVNAAQPPLNKTALMIKGMNGDVVRADEAGITTKLSSGKTESLGWNEIGTQAPQRLVALVIDPEKADDWLAAGLLALASGDADLAEQHFEQARQLGVDIGPYLAPLAERALAQANELLEKKQFSEADALLTSIEKKYAKTPWFASRRKTFDAARAAARTGVYEAGAEKLYAQAAKLFKDNEPFDLKPLVDKLKTDYADSQAVTDTDRDPLFSKMEQAVANLGKLITVRLGGRGDHENIQDAVNAAPPKSMIEIQDAGPYNEEVKIPREKPGLTLRGKKGAWPIIASVTAEAENVSIEQVIIVGKLQVNWGPVNVRSSILPDATFSAGPSVHLDTCVCVGDTDSGYTDLRVSNSVWLRRSIRAVTIYLDNVVAIDCSGTPGHLRHCTILGPLVLTNKRSVVLDSIIGSVRTLISDARIDYCNVFPGGYVEMARPGKNCISVDPQFVNPKGHDYRLGPNSPCRGKASDGGDLGCQYTPEMLEMLKLAFVLRAKGIITF